MASRRQSSRIAADRIRSQLDSDEERGNRVSARRAPIPAGRASLKRRVLSNRGHAPAEAEQQPPPASRAHVGKRPRAVKRAATGSRTKRGLAERLFTGPGEPQAHDCDFGSARRPAPRLHSTLYHRPLLLFGETGRLGRTRLLEWYDGVSEDRLMPWRKAFNAELLGPGAESRAGLSVRAYEVWISEIMLQQTRVAVVKDYWTRWMKKWPTVEDLAAAEEDEVMAAWRGLGYYSRARRILEAAKKVVQDPARRGLLPQTAKELEEEMAGVGRYTAGAISAIAFGNADCMVDGNVLRVLSRQLGILGDVKSDKAVTDLLWAAAQALVEAATLERSDVDVDVDVDVDEASDVPGRWGQALMELGSTVCTPQPNCVGCPISLTCRAFEEGKTIASIREEDGARGSGGLVDMEDACGICSEWDVGGAGGMAHVRKFPVKTAKKAVREEETVVCAVRRGCDGSYLIQRRPDAGLLAGLWELPSTVVPAAGRGRGRTGQELARELVAGLFERGRGSIRYVGELGSVPWAFSHLKLTMHVHSFQVEGGADDMVVVADRTRWADAAGVEAETMGTGMRHCWSLVARAAATCG
ncbi:hypothetical protein KVR01_007789 [Diaporthe batatas]|uniref:uncharacterized protein n=1 Tax=Diaporthe batatas TaxID=748121 RepID=UPI001D04F9A4|nr:uncharacterized protein KVR01_007789 [Diaporthe batatas]KAG8162024.1 hypothetical protein KVR01_007789 [Diaporthe batatas]